MSAAPIKVAVFIDWQNVYKTAREAFGLWQAPNERGNFSPLRLAQILAAGNGRGASADLVRVEVHRGLPSSSRDRVGFGANRRQATAWQKEGGSIVVPRLRPLRYPPGGSPGPPVEKASTFSSRLRSLRPSSPTRLMSQSSLHTTPIFFLP